MVQAAGFAVGVLGMATGSGELRVCQGRCCSRIEGVWRGAGALGAPGRLLHRVWGPQGVCPGCCLQDCTDELCPVDGCLHLVGMSAFLCGTGRPAIHAACTYPVQRRQLRVRGCARPELLPADLLFSCCTAARSHMAWLWVAVCISLAWGMLICTWVGWSCSVCVAGST